jgi:hypothetical protein
MPRDRCGREFRQRACFRRSRRGGRGTRRCRDSVAGVGIAVNFRGTEEGHAGAVLRRQFQHVPGARDRHIKRLERISAIVIRAGNAGRMNDVIDRTFPINGLGHIVLDEGKVLAFDNLSAHLASRQEVVIAEEGARLFQHLLVEISEHLGEVTPEKSARAGHDDRLAREILRSLAEVLRDLGDIGIEMVPHVQMTFNVGRGTM